MKKFITNLFKKEWTTNEKILTVTVASLTGIIVGILIAPVKKGISVGSYNGANNKGNRVRTTNDINSKKKKKKK